jgi:RHS repeat-associated protein
MRKRKKLPNMQRRRKAQSDTPQKTAPEPLSPPVNATRTAALASNGTETRYFIHGPLGLSSQQEPDGTWRLPIQDGLSSVRGVTDAALSILESRGHDPFGNPSEMPETWQTPFGFTSEMTDDNGLVYLRNRYYDPLVGVFPSPDPVPGNIHQPMSLNPYSYAQNNPANWVDPSGMVRIPYPAQYASCVGPGDNPPVLGQHCSPFVRSAAKEYALRWGTSYNPAYCNHDANTCGYGPESNPSDCANFVSQALWYAGHPMAWPGGRPELDLNDPRRDQYWAVECHTFNCDGTKAWSVATKFAAYLKQLPGSATITLTPRASYGTQENVLEMIRLHLSELGVSGISSGDVLFLPDSAPPHVAIVVGWGPAILPPQEPVENPNLTDHYLGEDTVPYVVDHGGQRTGPRPYYTLRWSLNGMLWPEINGSLSECLIRPVFQRKTSRCEDLDVNTESGVKLALHIQLVWFILG